MEYLDSHKIASYLSSENESLRDKMVIFNTLPSTNDYLLKSTKIKNEDQSVCLAEKQSRGRGRLGRSWHSPAGGNIYLSLARAFQGDLRALGGLSLAMAVAIVHALKRYGMQETLTVKWPNDVLYQKRKLAGVLIESVKISPRQFRVIVGVGLNVAMSESANQSIDQPWIDVMSILHVEPERNKLAGLLLDQLLTAFSVFQHHGFSSFLETWRAHDAVCGQFVEFASAHHNVKGIARGIDASGRFLLEEAHGKTQAFSAGELIWFELVKEAKKRCESGGKQEG